MFHFTLPQEIFWCAGFLSSINSEGQIGPAAGDLICIL